MNLKVLKTEIFQGGSFRLLRGMAKDSNEEKAFFQGFEARSDSTSMAKYWRIKMSREKFIEIYKNNIKREGADKLLNYLCEGCDFFTAWPPAQRLFFNRLLFYLAKYSGNVL